MRLKIVSTGSGPDLALIHGWGLGSGVWQEAAEALAANCRVHLVSLAGYDGQATDTLTFDATAAAIADQLPAGCTLCGWSLGGMLALSAALQRPRHIGRLVLVGSSPRFVVGDDWPHGQPPALLDTFRNAVAEDAKATLSRFVMLFNQGDEKARALSRSLAPLLSAELPDTGTLLRGLDWLGSVDLRAALASIAQPTLVLHGDKDPLMPIAAAEQTASALPDTRLVSFAGTAHAPFLADPATFVRQVSDFCHAAP